MRTPPETSRSTRTIRPGKPPNRKENMENTISEENKLISRRLTEDEKRLLALLLLKASIIKTKDWLDSLWVTPLNDGGMGSYYIVEESFTKTASDILFVDEDSVPVLASLYVNNAGEPCEVDMWKMNYTKLLHIPNIIIDIRDH